jgi:hypothetical protein
MSKSLAWDMVNGRNYVTGDMALETLEIMDFWWDNLPWYEKEALEREHRIANTPEFEKMAFKDDDGYWRVAGSIRKFDTYEDLAKVYGEC